MVEDRFWTVGTEDRVMSPWRVRLLFVLLGVLYLGSSFVPEIFDETEGQYAGGAREMMVRGDCLTPSNDGIPRLQKPPLVYGCLLISYKVFGFSVFAARFPNAIAALFWVWGTYLLAKKIGGERLGFYSALIQGTFFGFYIFGHLIMPEVFLGAWLTWTFWCFFQAITIPSQTKPWFLLSWFFMGLACLTKGLHGFLYPVMVVGVSAILFRHQRKVWIQFLNWRSLVLFLVMLVPWYIWMEVKYPGFLYDHFVNEQVGHLLNRRYPPDSRATPSFIFWIQHFVLFLPWTLFIPATIWAWKRAKICPKRHFKLEQILWIWMIVTAISVVKSARQDYYTMTCWSGVAVWMALPWAARLKIPKRWLWGPCLMVMVAGCVGLVLQGHMRQWITGEMGGVLPVVDRDNIFNAVTGFSSGSWSRLIPAMEMAGWILLITGIIGSYFTFRKQSSRLAMTFGVGSVLLLGLSAWGLSVMGEYFSLAKVADKINKNDGGERSRVVCEGAPHLATSLFFYMEQPIYWVNAEPEGEFASRKLGIGENLFLSVDQLKEYWRSSQKIYLITEESTLPGWRKELQDLGREMVEIGRSGTRVVMVNQRLIK